MRSQFNHFAGSMLPVALIACFLATAGCAGEKPPATQAEARAATSFYSFEDGVLSRPEG